MAAAVVEERPEYAPIHWTDYAPTFEDKVGKITGAADARLVAMAHGLLSLSEPETRVLDQGAGTGVLTEIVAKSFPDARVVAADWSAGMLQEVRDKGLANVGTEEWDASKEPPSELGLFSHALSSVLVQFMPDQNKAVEVMCKVLRPGGVLGLVIWDAENCPWDAWRKACQAVDEDYVPLPAHDKDAWYSCKELKTALEAAGCGGVVEDRIRVTFPSSTAKEFVDFWFDGGNPSAVGMINDWKKGGKGGAGKLPEVRAAYEKVIKEEYDDGKALHIWLALAAAVKPQ